MSTSLPTASLPGVEPTPIVSPATGQRTNKPAELKALTGARWMAAFWVLILHSGDYFPEIEGVLTSTPALGVFRQGVLGVDFFFILSGFVLSLNYHKLHSHFSLRNYTQFLLLRIGRIYPAHLFTLFVMLGLLSVGYYTMGKWPAYATWPSFVAHLFLVQAWSFPTIPTWNIPAWSVSAEWLAYLSFPVVLWLAFKLKSIAAQLIGIVLLLAVLIGSVTMIKIPGTAGYALLRIATEFPTGCLLYLLYSRGFAARSLKSPWIADATHLASLLGLVMVSLYLPYPSFGQVVAVPFLALALFNLTYGSGSLAGLLARKPLQFLGRASYSIYLIQMPCFLVLDKVLGKYAHTLLISLALFLVYVLVIIGAGSAVYLLVEEPCRKLFKRPAARAAL